VIHLSIQGPTILGECDDLEIDISESVGNGGRPWKILRFSFESSQRNIEGISQYLNNQASNVLN